MNKTIKDVRSGIALYPVWLHQAYHTLSAKYKRTILGTLWIAGNFVFVSLAVTVVFGALFHQNMKTFLPYSMSGNLCGTMCLWVIAEAPEIFLSSGGIIKNHAYPFTYFPLENVARAMMLFLHNLVVYYIFMAFNGTLVFPNWTLLPALALVILIMLFWGTIMGMLAARYRDLRFLLPSISTLFFFLTPIYWEVNMLGPKAWIAEINPLYNMVTILRQPLMGETAPSECWIYSLCLCFLGFVAWFTIFSVFRRRIPFWV